MCPGRSTRTVIRRKHSATPIVEGAASSSMASRVKLGTEQLAKQRRFIMNQRTPVSGGSGGAGKPNPVKVISKDGKYLVIAGHRRIAAIADSGRATGKR